MVTPLSKFAEFAVISNLYFPSYDYPRLRSALAAAMERARELGADAIAAFVTEPIQGTGGVNPPNADYLLEVQQLLTGKMGHLAQKLGMFRELVEQAHRCRRGLLLAIGMINQQHILLLQGFIASFAGTKPIAYSEFQQLLRDGRVAEVAVSTFNS